MSSGTNNAYILSFLALGFFLAAGVLYVFGLGAPGLFDVLEARSAVVSSQASSLVTALVNPTINAMPPDQGAPLFYGLQKLSMGAFGETVFAARLPSALAAFFMVFTFYNSVWLLTHARRYALLAAAALALSPGVLIAARLGTPDALVTFLTLAATMMLMGNIYQRERSYLRLFVVGLVMGLAFLAGGGVWAVILPFVAAFMLALVKDHRSYNIASLAPLSVVVAAGLALFPWLIAVLERKGTEGLGDMMFNMSHLQGDVGGVQAHHWWGPLAALAVLTLPWVFFALPRLWPGFKGIFKNIDNLDVRESLPPLALIWLAGGIGLMAVGIALEGMTINTEFAMDYTPGIFLFSLWLSAPVALLAADFFDRLPQQGLILPWFALLFVLTIALSVLFFWLPHMADILLGREGYEGFQKLLEGVGVLGEFQGGFWQGVLSVKPDWGLTPVVMGALVLVTLLMGGYLMSHGALEGALFVFVGMWFTMFFAAHGLTAPVYEHLQQPLKWMSVKVKKEHEATPESTRARVVLYAIDRPSVSYVTGLQPYKTNTPQAAFSTTALPLFVLTDKTHMPQLAPHVPAGAAHECFGGYCLIEVHR